MNLTTRNCYDCDSEFDVINDNYFTKRNNEKLFMILNVILYPALRGSYLKPKVRLICEACNRQDKLKKILK
jgi:hypothetical protein